MPIVEQQFNALISAIDAKFLTIAKWIDNHETRLNTLEGRISRLEEIEHAKRTEDR